MKLSHVIPFMVLILLFAGCGGKMKLHPDKIADEKTESVSQTQTEEDEKSNDGYYSNEGTHDDSKNKKTDQNYPTTIVANATTYGFTSDSNCMTDSTSVYIATDKNSPYNPLSSTGTSLGNDGIRKFVKTANLKFRVKSVVHATYDIEDITRRFGGFVATTSLESKIDNVVLTPVSKDSTLEATYYTVVNSLLLRIPEAKMDSALREISPLVDYMDYRNIKVEDVHIQLIADALAQTRLKNYQGRMKHNVDGKGRDLEDMNMAEENILSRQEEADNTTIANLTLLDKIEFATINIKLYQRQAIKREMVYNPGDISAYQPGLGTKIKTSLLTGWTALESVVLFVLRFWVLFVLGAVGFIFWRWWSRR